MSGLVRRTVLLPDHPDGACLEVAKRLGTELGCPVVARKGRTVAGMFREGSDELLVVSRDRVTYYGSAGSTPFFYHPGLAKNRIGGLARGEPDTLIRATRAEPGMWFLDATLGKASDAIVAAYVIGGTGRVDGVEANPALAAVVRLGLESSEPSPKALIPAMRRVRVHCADHLDFLRRCGDDAYDVVYFDPFFPSQVAGAEDMTALRAVGVHGEVCAEALAEARRVARLRVVHKVRVDRPENPALDGWELVRGKRRIGYRVWHAPGR